MSALTKKMAEVAYVHLSMLGRRSRIFFPSSSFATKIVLSCASPLSLDRVLSLCPRTWTSPRDAHALMHARTRGHSAVAVAVAVAQYLIE